LTWGFPQHYAWSEQAFQRWREQAVEAREVREPVVVVGVLPDQPLWVLQVAGEYARAFGARLVCVSVDSSRFTFQELPDGTLLSAPIQPELLDPIEAFPPERVAEMADLLDPMGVHWSTRQLVGEAATALIQIADEEDALMFVVGTRHTGFGGAVRKFFGGSVAVRLTHRQWRPVVVVPIEPTEADRRLPWEERSGESTER
jgi:nucleotide-binding universal stress UspA family protein